MSYEIVDHKMTSLDKITVLTSRNTLLLCLQLTDKVIGLVNGFMKTRLSIWPHFY